MVTVKVKIDLTPWNRMLRDLDRQAINHRVAQEILLDHARELTRRFENYGDGTWPANKDGTKTLDKTGRLKRSLMPGNDGNYIRIHRTGIEYGIAGGELGRIAEIHQNGEGKMPVREIVIAPRTDRLDYYASLIVKDALRRMQ